MAPELPTLQSDPKSLAADILKVLRYRGGKDASVATPYDWLTAAIKVVRDRIIDQWIEFDQGRPTSTAGSASTTCRLSS